MDISRMVGRGIRERVMLPRDLMGQNGHQAINRSLLGGSIAGLTAQGLNVMTGDPDGNDDMNVLAAIAMGSGIGAASYKLGQMNRNRIARNQAAADKLTDSFSPFGVGADRAMGLNSPSTVSEGYAPTMSAASNLPPLLKQAITPSANHGVPDGIPLGAATISDLGPGASNVAKTQVPTEVPGGIEVLSASPDTGRLSSLIAGTEVHIEPQAGMGPRKAYDSKAEAAEAARRRAEIEGKKKLGQGTALKREEKLKNLQTSRMMEDLLP